MTLPLRKKKSGSTPTFHWNCLAQNFCIINFKSNFLWSLSFWIFLGYMATLFLHYFLICCIPFVSLALLFFWFFSYLLRRFCHRLTFLAKNTEYSLEFCPWPTNCFLSSISFSPQTLILKYMYVCINVHILIKLDHMKLPLIKHLWPIKMAILYGST